MTLLISFLATDPFFLYFAPDSSHAPVYASEAFRGKSRRGAYGDAVMELDWAVGQIINELEGNNLLEDTIVIFSSDNGASCIQGTKEQGYKDCLVRDFLLLDIKRTECYQRYVNPS